MFGICYNFWRKVDQVGKMGSSLELDDRHVGVWSPEPHSSEYTHTSHDKVVCVFLKWATQMIQNTSEPIFLNSINERANNFFIFTINTDFQTRKQVAKVTYRIPTKCF